MFDSKGKIFLVCKYVNLRTHVVVILPEPVMEVQIIMFSLGYLYILHCSVFVHSTFSVGNLPHQISMEA